LRRFFGAAGAAAFLRRFFGAVFFAAATLISYRNGSDPSPKPVA
jgi:preprotein translocase subunit SecG